MEEGHMVDRGHGWTIRWVQGALEKSFWKALKQQNTDRRSISVATYRCLSCGFLESYAPV
jgi:hypothetical protein